MSGSCLAVAPVIVGPLQVLLAILPALLLSLGGLVLGLLRPRAMWTAALRARLLAPRTSSRAAVPPLLSRHD